MNPEEFKMIMQSLSKLHELDIVDTEEVHQLMDKVMCRCLSDHGYEDGIKIFEDELKYYA